MAAGPVSGDRHYLYGEVRFFPDQKAAVLVEDDHRKHTGRGTGRGRRRDKVPDGLYGTGGYHRDRKYRGSGDRTHRRGAGSTLLDVGVRRHWHDDRLCGDHAWYPLPLPG